MKTLILTLILLFGSIGFAAAQTDTGTKRERSTSKKEVKRRKPMQHFDKMKPDRKMKYNSTQAYHEMHPETYVVDRDGFSAPAYNTGKNKHSFRKRRNRSSSCYALR